MAAKKSAAVLAVQMCDAVMALRVFGDNNSVYQTRLENEISKRGWRMDEARIEKIRSEMHQRQAELDSLMAKLRQCLTDFGTITKAEEKALGWYWDEATVIRDNYNARARDITANLPTFHQFRPR
ncbi:hypothetical protein LUCX_99 [Xanthomonas phage vB_XciM_LucasX]|nr:hypothetical protein LUCX_99 [Xanthomonas phage vB_XciM_LucasX]